MRFYKKIMRVFTFVVCISIFTVVANGYTMPEPLTCNWANPRAGGEVSVLFICSVDQQYEVMVLADSFDLTYDIAPLRPAQSWHDGDDYDPAAMNTLRNYLSQNQYDAIVMATSGLGGLADDIEQTIHDKIVTNGVGFVYALAGIFPRISSMQPTPSTILDPLMPIVLDTSAYKTMRKLVIPYGTHWLSRGQDLLGRPWLTNLDSAAAAGATVLLRSEQSSRILAACIDRGNGRVVAYNRCYQELTSGYPFLPSLYEAFAEDETITGKWCRWLKGVERSDQFFSWLGRTILWAAKKDTSIGINSVQISGNQITVNGFNNTGLAQNCVVTGQLRSPYNSNEPNLGLNNWTIPANSTDQLVFTLPSSGYSGGHMLDVSLQDTSGNVWDWYSKPVSVDANVAIDYAENFSAYTPQDTVNVSLDVTSYSGTTCTVHTELFDLDGRLLFEKEQDVTVEEDVNKIITVSIPLAPTNISSRLANLRITANTGGLSAEIRDQLFVKQAPDWGRLRIGGYDGYGWYLHPATDALLSALKGIDHDTILCGYPTPSRMRYSTESGMYTIPLNFARSDITAEDVNWMTSFSPLIYNMADEPELQFSGSSEGTFSNIDLGIWLQDSSSDPYYASIGELNTAWGTSYSSWSEVTRRLWFDVWDTNNWAPWFDSRRQLDGAYLEQWGARSDIVRAADPNRLAYINLRNINTFTGIDMRAFARRMNAMGMYTDFVRSDPLGYLHLGGQWVDVAESCIGYTWPTNPGADRIRRELWDTIRHGTKIAHWFAPLYYETPPSGDFAYLNPDLTPNAKGLPISQVNHDVISSGAGDLASATEPLDEGVFIYYPRSLFYASTLGYMEEQLDANPLLDPATMESRGPWTPGKIPCSFVPHLRALGYQFGFGDEYDLTAQKLANTRVVFLSNVICMGEDKLQLLKDFVDAGGCVIAEAGTARRDDLGKVNNGNAVDLFCEIFGVERITPNLSPSVGTEDVVNNCSATIVTSFTLPGVLYQKGRAFFLNFELSETNEALEAVGWMLSDSGVDASYSLVNNFFSHSVAVRTKGDIKYLFVTKDTPSGSDNFYIDFSGNQQVYDVLSDQHLGSANDINSQVIYSEAKLFALSPSPVSTFEISMLSSYEQGEEFSMGFTLDTQDSNSGDRMIKIEFNEPPEGSLPDIPRTTILINGSGSITGSIPFNCPLGEYQIIATDLTSGTQCQDTFNVANKPVSCLEAIGMGYGIAGDFDENCYVDLKDLADFAQRWLYGVNMADYVEFAEEWMKCIAPEDPLCDHSAWQGQ